MRTDLLLSYILVLQKDWSSLLSLQLQGPIIMVSEKYRFEWLSEILVFTSILQL